MPAISTLSSPGVEIHEYDNSIRANISAGTTVFIPGFASQGPVEEINSIGSIEEFEAIYGQPTNAAERYFYYTVKAVLDESGAGTTVLTSRLPYGAGSGDNVSNAFTLLAYPAIPIIKNKENTKGYDYFEFTEPDKLKELLTLVDKNDEEITPDSITTNIIINSKAIDAINNSEEANGGFIINSIELNGALPDLSTTGYLAKPVLNYVVDGKEVVSDGAVSIESIGSNYVYHFTFSLSDSTNAIGIAIFDITVDKTAIDDAEEGYTSIKKHDEPLALTLEYCAAFTEADSYNTEDVADNITYLIGAPVEFQISLYEYYQLTTGELFTWSDKPYSFNEPMPGEAGDTDNFGMFNALKHSAFIAINPSRTIINDSFEGYYLGITDNLFNSTSDGLGYNAIKSIKITTDSTKQTSGNYLGILDDVYQTLGAGRLDFALESSGGSSISQIIQNGISTFDNSSTEYDDTLNIGLFRIKKSTTANEVMKLTYSVTESYNGSLGQARQYSVSTAVNPRNYFIENLVENSLNLSVLVNPHIAKSIYIDTNGNLRGKVRVMSSKLIENIDYYEGKYISAYRASNYDTSTARGLLSSVKLAQSSINSWETLIKQAGVSATLLKSLAAENGTFSRSDSLYPFGVYSVAKVANKHIGSVPSKVDRALALISNDEEYPDIDIICEGGLGTIYVYSNATHIINNEGANTALVADDDLDTTLANHFDDTLILAGIEDLRTGRTSYSEEAQAVVEDYLAVQSAFLRIANSETNGGRGNTFYIPDMLRGILIKGKNAKVQSLYGTKLTNSSYNDVDVVNHSWATSIYYPIKHLTNNLISSFASYYAQYFKIVDAFSGEKVWQPASGFVAGLMCASDQLLGPWEAAAGITRGTISGVIDVAVNPTASQRSDLYKICVNSIPNLPNSGPTIWGIRTLSKKASAFDQNTCRRTFLYIEKVAKQTLRQFVFERNDDYTRLKVYNALEPFMDSLVRQGAIYNYTLVCDSSNNTADIINNGELVVDLAAAPERTAENIVINVTANSYTNTVVSSISVAG